ncbi:hypothetical protein NZ45_18835 [Clostridium botulinum]|uniref:FtsK gamma domain-containing protein n=1 Tax=Clostridium botulinum TaxID=1491 RepID=A0ABD7CQN7_CLOBO|nr:DNA translocase FtsK [Clostridium botulinum]KGO12245.1 hypothetical protein NZ45_18835 [Clostridium botulinum]QRI55422.1 hypothetical protein JQS73_12720 [Clostridium botulinum]
MFDDYSVLDNCKNLESSFGEICVKCNKCGRFELAMGELKVQAIDIFKKYPGNINADLLRRYLKIGLIKANKLIESLENDGLISECNKSGKRKLLIR